MFSCLAASREDPERLPQDHPYQIVLCHYLAGLSVEEFTVVPEAWRVDDFLPADSDDALYRLWLLAGKMPSLTVVSVPPESFLLSEIEHAEGIRLPYVPAQNDGFYWLPGWEHPGNPYRGSVPLKKRAFVMAVIDALMLDARHEGSDAVNWDLYGLQRGRREGREQRSNSLAGTLIWMAHAYVTARDALPGEVREAYEHVLGKFVRRIDDWGPTGMNSNMDLFAAPAFGYVLRAVDDPPLHDTAREYLRRLYTDPQYFDPAGYTVEIQGYDPSYSGIALYKHTWGALMRTWDFEREALDAAYRLKAHMILPEPDEVNRFGPTHFSTRTSADAAHDQWGWPSRDRGAAMISDEALCFVRAPDIAEMEQGVRSLIQRLNAAHDAPPPSPRVWSQRHWTRAVNYAYDFYVPGSYDRLVRLESAASPRLDLPVVREEQFLRRFGEAFVVARFPGYAAILHTGPVGRSKPDWPDYMPTRDEAYWGLSGGALSAFWTPDAGSLLLGRRGGYLSNHPDFYEQWRMWATHAVSGQTEAGRVFSSAHTLKPEANLELEAQRARVRLHGIIPRSYPGYGESLKGTIGYRREILLDADGVHVTTGVSSDGQDALAELYETLPVFLRETRRQPETAEAVIEWRTAGGWQPAGAETMKGVRALRVKRFAGGALIEFDRPRGVRLAADAWEDDFQSRAACRTVLVDLLEDAGEAFRAGSVTYRIRPFPTP